MLHCIYFAPQLYLKKVSFFHSEDFIEKSTKLHLFTMIHNPRTKRKKNKHFAKKNNNEMLR